MEFVPPSKPGEMEQVLHLGCYAVKTPITEGVDDYGLETNVGALLREMQVFYLLMKNRQKESVEGINNHIVDIIAQSVTI